MVKVQSRNNGKKRNYSRHRKTLRMRLLSSLEVDTTQRLLSEDSEDEEDHSTRSILLNLSIWAYLNTTRYYLKSRVLRSFEYRDRVLTPGNGSFFCDTFRMSGDQFDYLVNVIKDNPVFKSRGKRRQQPISSSFLRGQIRQHLDKTLMYGCLTFDSWTSAAHKPYLGITIHWIDAEFRPQECVLALVAQPYPHTAPTTAQLVRSVLKDWDIYPRIVAVTTDSAPVMIKTVGLLSKAVIHVPCIAHALHNCVKSSLSKSVELQAVIEKCHSLAMFFRGSPKMAQKLYEEQLQDFDATPLVVIADVVTRWNSTFHMLKRLVALRSFIVLLPMRLEIKDCEKLKELTPSSEEWEQVDVLIKLLEPFEALTNLFSSSEHGLAASIGPQCVGLLAELKDAFPPQSDMSDSLYADLRSFHSGLRKEVRNRIELSEELAMATTLHPTFNNLWIYPDPEFRDKVLSRLRAEYYEIAPCAQLQTPPSSQELEPTEGNCSGLNRLLKRRRVNGEGRDGQVIPSDNEEIERYLQLYVADNVDPHKWWRENQENFPHIAFLARKYLAIPASSVASERMFSYSGEIVTDRRNCLNDDAISDIVFCHYANKCIQHSQLT